VSSALWRCLEPVWCVSGEMQCDAFVYVYNIYIATCLSRCCAASRDLPSRLGSARHDFKESYVGGLLF
jgi:hypothetical protein